MSRIYHAQPPKQSSSHAAPAAAVSASSSAASLTTPAAGAATAAVSGGSRVSANVKLFTNNLNANSSNQPSPSSSNASSPSLPPKTTAAPNNNKSTSSGGANTATKTTNPTSITNINNKTHTSPTTTPTTTTTPPTAVTNTVLPTPVAELDQMAQENISQLITRLEKVANRLESVAVSAASQSATTTMNGTASKTAAVAHDDTESSASIVAYDDLLNNSLTPFVQLSAKIGADVKSIADLVEKAFKYQRSFLVDAARSAQPSQDVLAKFYPLFSKNIEEVSNFREKNRKSEFFNHLSAISESIGALGWIAVSPAPSPYVKEMSDAAQFYTNRVLKDYKEKDPNHALWVKQWLQLLSELQAYVKQYHTTGVAWNSTKRSGTFDPSQVGSGSSASVAATAAPAAVGAGGPPPPPPCIPDFPFHLFTDDGKSASNTPSSQALFAEINKGGAITSHLKKVTDDQKTHKNPALRGGNTVPAAPLSATSSATSLQSKPSTASVKPPVFELEDKKWRVEYMQNRNDLVIDQTDLKHTVYIYQCNGSTVTVKGKVNSIIVDSCNRVGLLFDDVLSTVEFINSRSVQMQVLGKVPTVSIEKTDSCQVYLSRDSLHTEIVSSKSSAMNVLVPNEHDDDYTEQPVPEQFKTLVNLKTRKLETTQTDI